MELRKKANLMAQNVCIPTGSASLSHAELSECFRVAMVAALEWAAGQCDTDDTTRAGIESRETALIIRAEAERLQEAAK